MTRHPAINEHYRHYFKGAETNSRIASSLGIVLMNSNCFAAALILVMSVQISIMCYVYYKSSWTFIFDMVDKEKSLRQVAEFSINLFLCVL